MDTDTSPAPDQSDSLQSLLNQREFALKPPPPPTYTPVSQSEGQGWPKIGDTVYVAEYGHGARKACVAARENKFVELVFWDGMPYRTCYLDSVFRTAAEAEWAAK
jgi:hypothetical protein